MAAPEDSPLQYRQKTDPLRLNTGREDEPPRNDGRLPSSAPGGITGGTGQIQAMDDSRRIARRRWSDVRPADRALPGSSARSRGS